MTTGRLFVADVGQDTWEEIDIVEKGGNYGWRILEGNHPYDLALADQLGINISTLEPPTHDYSHNVGHSIIGGYVYRGTQYPRLVGKYVFGDWSTDYVKPGGTLYYLEETQPTVWKRYGFAVTTNKPLHQFILGFGEDENGELYVLTTRIMGSLFPSGDVWHIKVV
jgi:glucose/arabinose dehydrogenase